MRRPLQVLIPIKAACALKTRIRRDLKRGVFNIIHLDLYTREAAAAIVAAEDKVAAFSMFVTANLWE